MQQMVEDNVKTKEKLQISAQNNELPIATVQREKDSISSNVAQRKQVPITIEHPHAPSSTSTDNNVILQQEQTRTLEQPQAKTIALAQLQQPIIQVPQPQVEQNIQPMMRYSALSQDEHIYFLDLQQKILKEQKAQQDPQSQSNAPLLTPEQRYESSLEIMD
jgi:hypothetical protein